MPISAILILVLAGVKPKKKKKKGKSEKNVKANFFILLMVDANIEKINFYKIQHIQTELFLP